MVDELGLVTGPIASQIGYSVSEVQERIIERAGVFGLDMECAPIAQIVNQTGVNMIAVKVVSNGVYPGEPKKMESEYHDNRAEVSRRATKVIEDILEFMKGKT
eukprot:gene10898-17355_t